jgi:hypothetical protein
MGYKKIIPKHPGANSSNMTMVGIAETDPKVNLDVKGNVRVQDAHSLMFGRNGDDYAWRVRNESAQDNSTYGFTSTNKLVFEVVSNSGLITGSGSPPPSDDSHNIYTSSANTLVLLESGKIGIGTDDPAVELDVIGYAKVSGVRFGTADKWKIRANSANEEIAFEYANGDTAISDNNIKAKFRGENFGIGSSMTSANPESRIHIKDGDSGSTYSTDGADKLIIEDNDSVAIDLRSPSANQGLLMFSDGTRGVGSIGYAHTNDQLNFKTGGAARFEIDSNGRLHAIYGFSRGAPFPHYYHKRSAQLQAGSSSKKKARVGRIYWTSGHWSAGGVSLHARVGSEYYSGENRLYHFSAQYTDSEVSYKLLESHSKHSNNTRIYLGAVTTSHTYSGQPCKYQDIWVEANSYKRIHVDFTSLGKSGLQQISSTDITSGWGGVVVYDSLQDAADISDFTDELINYQGDHFIATSDKVNDTLNQGEFFGFNQIQSGSSLNFSTSTYKYTAPITGVYLFGANVYRNSSSGGNISFRRTTPGGATDDFGRIPQQFGSGDHVYVMSQMKYLEKGDTVGVYNYGATFSNFYGSSDDNYSSFYGHLVRSTM